MDIVEPEAVAAEAALDLVTAEPADRLAELYQLHASGALGFAYLLCGDRAVADDAVQEAFERVMGRLGNLRSPDAFAAYLRRTVLNVLRTRARAEQRARRREEVHVRDLSPRRAGADVDADPDGRLWSALQGLPDRQRAAVVCRYWADLSERDTARVLRCRPGTVKSLLSRGLASLRESMGDRNGGEHDDG
jgi:RNA polymerase sigma factor (sigma-70 family)